MDYLRTSNYSTPINFGATPILSDSAITKSPNGVIIPYDSWENYYKDLQSNYEKLLVGYAELEQSKDIRITFDKGKNYGYSSGLYKSSYHGIYTVYMHAKDSFTAGTPEIKRRIKAELESVLEECRSEIASSYYAADELYFSAEDIRKEIETNSDLLRRTSNALDSIECALKSFRKYVKSFPFFIRWMFNLDKKINEQISIKK